MRERVEALGGRLEVSGSPGRGARVHVWIPIADGDDGAAPWSR
jgi:signal transduction histidine kinase